MVGLSTTKAYQILKEEVLLNTHRTKKKVVGIISTRRKKVCKLHHATKLKPYMKEWAVDAETVMSQFGMTLD